MASATKTNETLNEANKAMGAKDEPAEQQEQITRVTTPTQRLVLLLVGSFNPVTIAHLRMFELARDYYHLRSVHVVEGIISPVSNGYGKPGLAPAKDRIDMVRAAIRNDHWLRVDTWESEQPTWTRTKLVLDHHLEEVKKRHGESTGLRLLLGADVARSMLNKDVWMPQDILDIMTKYGVACITRLSAPESGPGGATTQDVKQGMPEEWKRHIESIQDWVVNDISATNIRKRLNKGLSVKYIVPDAAIEVIHQHGFYNPDKAACLADWPFDGKQN